MGKFIFYVSPQHTGTWFTINLLLDHVDVESVIQLHNVRPSMVEGVPQGDRKEFVHKTGINVIHTHIKHWVGDDKIQFGQSIFFTMLVLPTICTMRDPLLALITRLCRQPGMESSDVIYGFVAFFEDVEALKDINPPTILCMDVGNSFDERRKKIFDALTHVGLTPEPLSTTWALSWPSLEDFDTKPELRQCYNAHVMYPAKQAYMDGDIKFVIASVGSCWEVLREAEPILRPPLEALGYNNLMWWS